MNRRLLMIITSAILSIAALHLFCLSHHSADESSRVVPPATEPRPVTTVGRSESLAQRIARKEDVFQALAPYAPDHTNILITDRPDQSTADVELLRRYVNSLIREHFDQQISHVFHQLMKDGRVVVAVRSLDDSSAHAAFMLARLSGQGLTPTMILGRESLMNERPERLKLSLFHEVQHMKQAISPRFQVTFIQPAERPVDTRVWFELEFEANLFTAVTAINLGDRYIEVYPLASILLDGVYKGIELALRADTEAFPERDAITRATQSRDHRTLFTQSMSVSPKCRAVLQAGQDLAKTWVRKHLATMYVEQGRLTPHEMMEYTAPR